jgi:hypothetical protein
MLAIVEALYAEKGRLWILVKIISLRVLNKEVEFRELVGLYKWVE